jgi:hypothetical protein
MDVLKAWSMIGPEPVSRQKGMIAPFGVGTKKLVRFHQDFLAAWSIR